jgi:hypothetical protein
MNLEGSGYDLIDVPLRHLPEGTEENNEISRSGLPAFSEIRTEYLPNISLVRPLHTNLFGEMSYISISVKPVGISTDKLFRLPVSYLVLLNTRSVIASYTFTAPEDHFRITISQALTAIWVFTLRQQTWLEWKYRAILIIVGVSVAYNFQTGRNKIKLLTKYESVTQKVLLSVKSMLQLLNSFNLSAFRITLRCPSNAAI